MESTVFERPYIPLISVLFITTLVALFNIPIMATLWRYSFDDGTYSHAYLIPFIVLYLYFTLHESNELQFREKLSWLALVILLISAYGLFVATTAQITLAYWLATLILLCAAINFVFKPTIKLFFPALYFIFLIPLWGILTVPLQNISVIAVNTLMSLTNIPVFVENQFVHIPSGVFEIAGGCSGLRYLLTSLAISSLYIFLHLRNIKNITLFASIAILGALITNWLRIAILIIIGHETEMTSSLMADHNMFGWYLYAPFMLLLFKLGGYLTDKENDDKSEVNNIAKIHNSKFHWPLISMLFITLILSSTSIKQAYFFTSFNKAEIISSQTLTIQPLIFNYSSLEIKTQEHDNIYLIYHFNGNQLEGKPTFFDNNLIPEGWNTLNEKIIDQQQVISIQKGQQRATLKISYKINGKEIATARQFKKARLKEALSGQGATSLHWHFKQEL